MTPSLANILDDLDIRVVNPAHVEFLNLARIKKLMDGWYDEHFQDVRRLEAASRPRLPEPMVDTETKQRVSGGFRELSAILKAAV